MQAVYDGRGNGLTVGDRIELSPACDLWMQGARYGMVVRFSLTPKDRVHFTLDKTGEKVWCSSSDMVFRIIEDGSAAT